MFWRFYLKNELGSFVKHNHVRYNFSSTRPEDHQLENVLCGHGNECVDEEEFCDQAIMDCISCSLVCNPEDATRKSECDMHCFSK